MAMHLPGIENLEASGKKILLRVDYNVPLDKVSGAITDETRIIKSLPTLQLLLSKGASLVIVSHMGRPEKKNDPFLSLKKVADVLQKHLPSNKVLFSEETIGPKAEKIAADLQRGEILVLENIRFYDEETSKDEKVRKDFATKLCKLANIYVDDAFGAAHRAHASIYEAAFILPAYAGLLLKKEIDVLHNLLTKPEKPVVAIIGGAKVSSKLAVLENLTNKADIILIGGAMAYTFLKSRLLETGSSLVEKDYLSQAFQIIDKANYRKCNFVLPEDHVIANEYSEKAKVKTCGKQIPDGWMGMDIGPKTTDKYVKIIKEARTVLWNGPMGVFEMDKFAGGTMAIAKALTKVKGTTIVGGGDSVYAVTKAGVEDKVTHVSTGGGATLEYLEGKKLPGVEALLKDD
jgi:phosphoglycerate kinase